MRRSSGSGPVGGGRIHATGEPESHDRKSARGIASSCYKAPGLWCRVRAEAAALYTAGCSSAGASRFAVTILATDMDHYRITVKGPDGAETTPTRIRVWAAGCPGVTAGAAARPQGGTAGRPGRPDPGPARLHDCRTSAGGFAIGDVVSLTSCPGVAQPAIHEGQVRRPSRA